MASASSAICFCSARSFSFACSCAICSLTFLSCELIRSTDKNNSSLR